MKIKFTSTYLFSVVVSPSAPRVHSWPPVLQDELLRVFLTLAIAEATLGPGGGHNVRPMQLHLKVLVRVSFDLVSRTPGAAVFVQSQSAMRKTNICFQ
jgi:hypothetical protein